MPRLLLVLLCALLCVSLGTTSIAHAAEAGVCVEQLAAHAEDQAGQDEPADKGGKSRFDQHMNCHGHQLASLEVGDAMPVRAVEGAPPGSPGSWTLHAATTDPALRPPQA